MDLGAKFYISKTLLKAQEQARQPFLPAPECVWLHCLTYYETDSTSPGNGRPPIL